MTSDNTVRHEQHVPAGRDFPIQADELVMRFGRKRVIDGISLNVTSGEILAIVGGSGSGKSTLMRMLALLQTPTSGSVRIFGTRVEDTETKAANLLRQRLGVMFQHGALFGDLTVLENVSVPLQEHTHLSQSLIEQIAMVKIELAGLEPDSAALYPSQLSGGMRKRAAVARGILAPMTNKVICQFSSIARIRAGLRTAR